MGMHFELRQSQALSLRQELFHRLEQSLITKQEMRMELRQYQEREDTCTRLYENALKKGNVRRYQGHGMDFEFALVSTSDVPKRIYEESGPAFAHCLMNSWDVIIGGEKYAKAKGSWLLLVIYDMYPDTPAKILGYMAVHERGEMITLGEHHLATKLEFAIARREERLRGYMRWIEQNCPGKFADVFSYQTHIVLPESEELDQLLQTFLASEEAKRVRTMIEEFEWPYSILQRLNKYCRINEKVIAIIREAFRAAAVHVSQPGLKVIQMVAGAKQEIEKGFQRITEGDLNKYISVVRIEEPWREMRKELNDRFLETLNRKQKAMEQPAYIQEISIAGIVSSLPNEGIMSPNFKEALALF